MRGTISALTWLFLLGSAGLAAGQTQPEPAPPAPPVPAAQDTAYPGVLKLDVDASDTARHIFHVRESMPVAGAGPMTLLYPQWLPGNHSPTGQIDKFAGLIVTADGKPVSWRRDPVNVYAFHLDVPQGAKALDLSFQFLSPTKSDQGRMQMTPAMLSLQWNELVLYPAGYFSRDLRTEATVKLPTGWQYGTALRAASKNGDSVRFKPEPLNTLVDSPLIAGRFFEQADLDPGAQIPVALDIVADKPELLQVSAEALAAHRALVTQAYRLFGSHHYDHYDFLLSLSDQMGGIGLEHHRSSEDGTVPGYFVHWDQSASARDLLPHEFTHSWNGKFRRPADLWTANFNVPMRDSLLWVYEGQTQYWGHVLAARSGLVSKQEALESLALTAAVYDQHVGHEWRPLEDTTNDPVIAMRRPLPWRSYQLSEDYYSVGMLTWLDADTLIRKQSGGTKSLDDFARAFFGVDDGSFVTRTYDLADIVRALSEVVPYDWAKFLHSRVDETAKTAPLDGLERGGYKLVYSEKESAYQKSAEALRKSSDFTFSLGFTIGSEGALSAVQWGSPAFAAGLTPGSKLVALNGTAFDTDALKLALDWGRTHNEPLTFLVENNKTYRTVTIDYHGGQRYPHLEPAVAGARSLDAILAAR